MVDQTVHSAKPEPGKSLNITIPAELRDDIVKKLSHDVNGNTRKGEDGKEVKISVIPPRENGSYKGRIIKNDDKYMVQALGKAERFAVVHDKSSVEFVGSKLKWLNENDRLQQSNLQVHYNGERGKAYPHNPDKAVNREEVKEKDSFEKKMLDYADTIKDPRKRNAFLKHMEAAKTQVEKAGKPLPLESKAKAPAAKKGREVPEMGR